MAPLRSYIPLFLSLLLMVDISHTVTQAYQLSHFPPEVKLHKQYNNKKTAYQILVDRKRISVSSLVSVHVILSNVQKQY
jgi:hypothetical protein